MAVINAIQGSLSILMMIGLGYFLCHKGWFDDSSSRRLSRLIVNISLPAYMVYNLLSTYSRSELIHLVGGLAVPFISIGMCYAISMVISRWVRIPKSRRGIFCCMFSLSNTIFIGLPVNLALFGEKSVPYVLLYYIANTSFFWTIGVYGIRKDGGQEESRLFSLQNIKKIFSPPLSSFLLGVVLILLGIHLPKSIMDTCKYVGSLTTPLSMIFIGIVIHSVNFKEMKIDRGAILIMAGRFIISPLAVIGLSTGITVPGLMRDVFVIQSAMPAATQTSIISEAYHADYKYAAYMVTLTTLVSLVTIPIYMLLLTNILPNL